MTVGAAEVAAWMLRTVLKDRILYQQVAVSEIAERFGGAFAGVNSSGNLCIAPKVLTAFRKLSTESVVWERSERAWRLREGYDSNGRQQS